MMTPGDPGRIDVMQQRILMGVHTPGSRSPCHVERRGVAWEPVRLGLPKMVVTRDHGSQAMIACGPVYLPWVWKLVSSRLEREEVCLREWRH